MQAFKILVEECDTDFRKYHTNWELVRGSSKELRRNEVVTTSNATVDHKYDLAHEVVKLDGVTKVILSSYCLSVYIGKAFGWEHIELRALQQLIAVLVKQNKGWHIIPKIHSPSLSSLEELLNILGATREEPQFPKINVERLGASPPASSQ